MDTSQERYSNCNTEVPALPELAAFVRRKKEGGLPAESPFPGQPSEFGLGHTLFAPRDSSEHGVQVAVVRLAQSLGYVLGGDEAHAVDLQDEFGGEGEGIEAIAEDAIGWLNTVVRFVGWEWGWQAPDRYVFGLWPR